MLYCCGPQSQSDELRPTGDKRTVLKSDLPDHVQLKLTYFDLTGRAEAVRLAFAIGDVPFEDERIGFPEFAKIKDSTPFGQLPLLTVDGEVHAQSLALLVYAGRLAGLYPKEPLAGLKVHEVMAGFEDMIAKIIPTNAEPDLAKKTAMRAEIAKTQIAPLAARLEKVVARHGMNGFAAGDKLSIADLSVYCWVNFLDFGFWEGIPKGIINATAHPHLMKSYEHVKGHPAVRAFEAKHKK